MAYEKKTREEWDKIARDKSLQKTVDNIEIIRDAMKAAKLDGSDATLAMMSILIAELMKVNDNLFWIQKGLKNKSSAASDNIPF
jgi:hypothetical protein